MAKRKPKSHQGVHKTELQNEPIKFLLNWHEHHLLMLQVKSRSYTQSDYLRYLLLEAPHRTVREERGCSYLDPVTILGRGLNAIAKNINQAVLGGETIAIPTDETVLIGLERVIDNLNIHISQIQEQKALIRNIQVKFLVTPTQLAAAKAKLKVKKLTLSRYLRQQITGYKEVKYKTKAREIAGAVGRLGNNLNQIAVAIALEERQYRLVIVSQDTKIQIQHLQREIQSLQQQLLEVQL